MANIRYFMTTDESAILGQTPSWVLSVLHSSGRCGLRFNSASVDADAAFIEVISGQVTGSFDGEGAITWLVD